MVDYIFNIKYSCFLNYLIIFCVILLHTLILFFWQTTAKAEIGPLLLDSFAPLSPQLLWG